MNGDALGFKLKLTTSLNSNGKFCKVKFHSHKPEIVISNSQLPKPAKIPESCQSGRRIPKSHNFVFSRT